MKKSQPVAQLVLQLIDGGKGGKEQQSFTIENGILRGKVAKVDSPYTSVGKILFDALKSNPDAIGQVDVNTGIEDTLADITDRAVKCALWLKKHGVGKGDIVVISSHNHLDCIVPTLATLFIGATLNPWTNDMNTQLARHFVTMTGPKVIFANEKAAGVILEAAKIELFHTKVVSIVDHYPGTTPLSEVLRGHDRSEVDNFRCREIEDREDTALILFSSGTTALPKGVQLPHRALLNFLLLDDGMRLDQETPLWFSTLDWISGSLLTLKSIYSRSTRILAPVFDEKVTCEIIEKYKVTWIMLSTSMANRFVRFDGLQNYDLSSLLTLFTGGAPLNTESQDMLRKQLPHTSILQAYGMTELGGIISVQSPDTTSGSCGIVTTNCDIKIVDTNTGEILGPNQNGEVCARSWTMTTGYYKNPAATKQTIDKDGWLHTGDLAYYNEKGEIFIVDRIKELIKFRGYHVTPNEIENLLQSHPSVLEVAVVGIPHITDNEHPVAFVSKIPNKEVSAEELMKMVENTMVDSCKLRGGVRFLPNLPHTHSGKIARKDLKAIAKTLEVR